MRHYVVGGTAGLGSEKQPKRRLLEKRTPQMRFHRAVRAIILIPIFCGYMTGCTPEQIYGPSYDAHIRQQAFAQQQAEFWQQQQKDEDQRQVKLRCGEFSSTHGQQIYADAAHLALEVHKAECYVREFGPNEPSFFEFILRHKVDPGTHEHPLRMTDNLYQNLPYNADLASRIQSQGHKCRFNKTDLCLSATNREYLDHLRSKEEHAEEQVAETERKKKLHPYDSGTQDCPASTLHGWDADFRQKAFDECLASDDGKRFGGKDFCSCVVQSDEEHFSESRFTALSVTTMNRDDMDKAAIDFHSELERVCIGAASGDTSIPPMELMHGCYL